MATKLLESYFFTGCEQEDIAVFRNNAAACIQLILKGRRQFKKKFSTSVNHKYLQTGSAKLAKHRRGTGLTEIR